MLDPSLAAQLRSHLQRLTTPVELAMSLDDSAKSRETAELLTEVAAMSDLLTVVRKPRAALFEQSVLDRCIDDRPGPRDTLGVHDVELG